MKFHKSGAFAYVPDGTEEGKAVSRTSHLCIAAHQDDIELMCYHGISECFGRADKWFCGVVVTDGAGSPRSGLYAKYTDEEMKAVRITEQKKAAFVGEYGAQLFMNFSSSEIKNGRNMEPVSDFAALLLESKPEVLYTHNLADKHDTHVAVALRVIEAVRSLPKSERPKKVYGCEVWRGLDWVLDSEKVLLDVSAHDNIANSLVGVFDSQICGGKRYDLAAQGRRLANATYSESHGVDEHSALSYAVDLTPLAEDDSLDPAEYIDGYVRRFQAAVAEKIANLRR